jgi:hypothetical protein
MYDRSIIIYIFGFVIYTRGGEPFQLQDSVTCLFKFAYAGFA